MMKVFTYSQARQHLSEVLDLALEEEVEIRRRDGCVFSLRRKQACEGSPFDVPGIKTAADTGDIVEAVRESRRR